MAKTHALDADFIRDLIPKIPPKGDKTYWDSVHEGLGLRVRDGKMAFFWRRKLGAKSRKYKLNPVDPGKDLLRQIAFAHEKAIEYNQNWDRKLDVAHVIAEVAARRVQTDLDAENTFGRVYKAWVERVKKAGSDATDGDRRKIIRWLGGEAVTGSRKRKGGKPIPLPPTSELWRTPFKEVTKNLVAVAFAPYLDKPATVRKIYSYCSTAFVSEAANHKGIVINPFEAWFSDHKPAPPPRRKHYLELREVNHRAWLTELYAHRNNEDEGLALQADYLLCCLLWGGRATETAKLRIEDVHPDVVDNDFEEPDLPWAVFLEGDTKSGNAHYFPLTEMAVETLKSRIKISQATKDNRHGWVFPSREHEEEGGPLKHITGWGVRRLLDILEEKTGIKMRPHDLRRTLATEASGATDRDKGLIKLALNHARDVTDGYIQARADIDALRPMFQKREARFKRALKLEMQAGALPLWLKPYITNPAYAAEIQALLAQPDKP